MKKSLCLLGACAVLLGACSALAQGAGSGTNICTGTNDYLYDYSYSNHWFYTNSGPGPWYSDVGRFTNSAPPRVWTNGQQVIARTGPGGSATPAQVRAMVQKFQADRDTFMAQQQALKNQLSDASDQERDRIRDQLHDQMEQWKQDQSRLRDQLRDECDRLADQLRDHDRLMDRVSNPTTPPEPGSGPRGR